MAVCPASRRRIWVAERDYLISSAGLLGASIWSAWHTVINGYRGPANQLALAAALVFAGPGDG